MRCTDYIGLIELLLTLGLPLVFYCTTQAFMCTRVAYLKAGIVEIGVFRVAFVSINHEAVDHVLGHQSIHERVPPLARH